MSGPVSQVFQPAFLAQLLARDDVAAALLGAREDIDAVLWRRDVRAVAAEVAATSAQRGAHASATIDGAVWLRPCFTNFRTTPDDVAVLLDVAEELGSRCSGMHE